MAKRKPKSISGHRAYQLRRARRRGGSYTGILKLLREAESQMEMLHTTFVDLINHPKAPTAFNQAGYDRIHALAADAEAKTGWLEHVGDQLDAALDDLEATDDEAN